MLQELKLRIRDRKAIEELLLQKGATFSDETFFVDTYFNQPPGKVLKLTQKKNGTFVTIFQENHGKFDLVKDELASNVEELKKQYTEEYGIKRIMKGIRRYFQFGNYALTLNLIENVGDFLIVTGENPTKEFVENELGIKHPEYITVSFDQIKN